MLVVEIARHTGLAPEVIRYYTRIGLVKPNIDPANNYKHYSLADMSCLRFIRHARSLGFTLAEIGEILEIRHKGDSPCPKIRGIIQRHIEENRRALENQIVLQHRMESALVLWQRMPDEAVDDSVLCKLIEAIEKA
jgi:MerR family transcriptional regulator, Zn(II)-responsive regulator of zntA